MSTPTIQAIRATKIMIIRHGEKPADSPPPEGPFGVNVNGIQDHGHSLIVQGWQQPYFTTAGKAEMQKWIAP